jgi:hypothetical protein
MTDPTTIDDPGQPPPRPRRKWWARAKWVLIPLLVFATAEGLARKWVARVAARTFLHRAERVARASSIDFLFIGSSRVAAAVDADLFAEEVGRSLGRPVRAVNMGTGFSTLAEHELALRQLAQDHPASMQGCVVMIEAPGGIPDGLSFGHTRWDEPWSQLGEAIRLAPLLHPGDVPALWRSGFDLSDKIHFSLRALGNGSTLIAHHELIATTFFDVCNAYASSLLLRDRKPRAEAADLASDGGIRGDRESIERARRHAEELAPQWAEDRRVIGPSWDDRVIGSIVRRVHAIGGRVVFFETPLHSIQAKVLKSDLRQADRRAFREQARRWGVPLVELSVDYPDDAFPDIWHLARSRALEFTRALARAWLTEDGTVAGGPGPR